MSEPVKRITRQALFEKVWTTTLKKVAEELGVNYVDLVRLCEKLNVPRPSAGHWQRLKLGLPVESIPLPDPGPSTPVEAILLPKAQLKAKPGETLPAPEKPEVSREQNHLPDSAQAAAEAETRPELAAKAPAARLPPVASAVMNRIRQTSRFDFWADCLDWDLSWWDMANLLGLPKDHGQSVKTMAAELMAARAEYRTFTVDVQAGVSRDPDSVRISIRIKDGCEWRDVWTEAWTFSDAPNPHLLTVNALRLLHWAESEKNTGDFIDKNKIGRQACLRGSYDGMEELFREIRVKARPQLIAEGGGWRKPFKVTFSNERPRYYNIGPLNPALGISVARVDRDQLVRFKNWFYAELQRLEFPQNNELIGVFEIADRQRLKTCFSDWPKDWGWDHKLRDFFDALKLMPGIRIRHKFEGGPGPWFVQCSLAEGWTWSRVREWLKEQESAPPLRQKYRLSEHAAALLEWIIGLPSDDLLGAFTPAVEDHLELDIGIETDWAEENLPAYLAMLVDEINEKTEFDLRLQPWREYNNLKTRIRVKKKLSDLDSVVRAIQLFGLAQNKVFDAKLIKAMVEQLGSTGG